MGFKMYASTNDKTIEFPKFYGYAEERYVNRSWDFLKQDCEYNDMHVGECYGPVKLDSKSFAEFIDIYMDEYVEWTDISVDWIWIEYLRKNINEVIKSGKDVELDWH